MPTKEEVIKVIVDAIEEDARTKAKSQNAPMEQVEKMIKEGRKEVESGMEVIYNALVSNNLLA
jgi:hypothetical protein